MFWRSFNLTFKAKNFDAILMQPQKNLFFGFLFRALPGLVCLVSPFQFFVVLNSSPLKRFCFPLQKSAFFGSFSRFPQAAKMVLALFKQQKWFFNKQKRTLFERQQVWQFLKLLSSVFYNIASHFKVSIRLFQPLPSYIEQIVGSVFWIVFSLTL